MLLELFEYVLVGVDQLFLVVHLSSYQVVLPLQARVHLIGLRLLYLILQHYVQQYVDLPSRIFMKKHFLLLQLYLAQSFPFNRDVSNLGPNVFEVLLN